MFRAITVTRRLLIKCLLKWLNFRNQYQNNESIYSTATPAVESLDALFIFNTERAS